MTEKRFYIAESNLIDGYCVFDREKKYAFAPRERKVNCLNDCNIMNELNDENEQSKMMIATLRNMVLEQEDLEKENKELKEELLTVINQLYGAEESLIYEYSTDADDKENLKKTFQEKYNKYGWEEQ